MYCISILKKKKKKNNGEYAPLYILFACFAYLLYFLYTYYLHAPHYCSRDVPTSTLSACSALLLYSPYCSNAGHADSMYIRSTAVSLYSSNALHADSVHYHRQYAWRRAVRMHRMYSRLRRSTHSTTTDSTHGGGPSACTECTADLDAAHTALPQTVR